MLLVGEADVAAGLDRVDVLLECVELRREPAPALLIDGGGAAGELWRGLVIPTDGHRLNDGMADLLDRGGDGRVLDDGGGGAPRVVGDLRTAGRPVSVLDGAVAGGCV